MLLFFAFFIVSSYGEALQGTSYFTDHPPSADGIISIGEWNNASKMKLEHGFVTYTEREYGYLMAQNDAKNLYILFDVLEDTSENVSLDENSWQDYFCLSFDVDLDKEITPNVDVLFSPYPSNRSVLGKAFHIGPGTTTGMWNTASQLGTGFGSSFNSEIPHRFWEIAISLQEINSNPYGKVGIGYRIHSDVPRFTRQFPFNYTRDFSNLFEIDLGIIYEPEQQREPEKPEEFIENLKLDRIEIFLVIGIFVIICLVFVTLWTKKRDKDLQSRYKNTRRNFRQFKSYCWIWVWGLS